MSGEQQLERSVLEAKERDELHTIAEALSLKPGSRTKKADLIDQILRATGVDVPDAPAVSDAGDKPRRARRTRAAAPDEAAAGASTNGGPALDDAAGRGDADVLPFPAPRLAEDVETLATANGTGDGGNGSHGIERAVAVETETSEAVAAF